MGVLAYAIPPLGGRKRGQFDQFLRFCQSLAFHSYVYLRVLNKSTSNIHTTNALYRAVQNAGASIRNSTARGRQTWPL